MSWTLAFPAAFWFATIFLLVPAPACGGGGDAAARLSLLQQEILVLQKEADRHSGEADSVSSAAQVAEFEAKHRQYLETVSIDLEKEEQDLDACGFGSCCGGALQGLADQRGRLLAQAAEHGAAVATSAPAEHPALESLHRSALEEILVSLRGHHDSMSSAGMCCHCQSMH